MNEPPPSFAGLDMRTLFPPPPVQVGPGLRQVGGRITPEETMPVVRKFQQPTEASAAEFEGNWNPTRGANNEELIVGGGTIYDGATTHIIPETTVAVHATNMNYIYLECDLTFSTTDGYVNGGTVNATPTITSYTSVKTNDSSTAYILLHRWQAGELVQRYHWFSFSCELVAAGESDAGFRYW